MRFLIITYLFLVSTATYAGDLRLLEPREAYIDAYKNEVVHDPYLYPEDKNLGYGMGFNLSIDVLMYKGYGLHWDNLLHFDELENTGQVKAAGWQYHLGLVVLRFNDQSKIEVFKQHHSQHVLDEPRDEHFPVYDRLGIRLIIFEKGR